MIVFNMNEFENSKMPPEKILRYSEMLSDCAQWWEEEVTYTLAEMDETSDYARKEFLDDRMSYLTLKAQFESKEMKKIEDIIDNKSQKKAVQGSMSFVRSRKD